MRLDNLMRLWSTALKDKVRVKSDASSKEYFLSQNSFQVFSFFQLVANKEMGKKVNTEN